MLFGKGCVMLIQKGAAEMKKSAWASAIQKILGGKWKICHFFLARYSIQHIFLSYPFALSFRPAGAAKRCVRYMQEKTVWGLW